MSDKPNRRYWQIHLSTALLMTFVFGGLLAIETAIGDKLNSWIAAVLKPLIAPAADSVWIEGPFYILPSLFFNSLVVVTFAYFVERRIRRREARKRFGSERNVPGTL